MVRVTDLFTLNPDGWVDVDVFLENLQIRFKDAQYQTIISAYDLALKLGVDLPSQMGGNMFRQGVEMAAILFSIQADEDAIAAAFLVEIYLNDCLDVEEVKGIVSEVVLNILQGVDQMKSMRTRQKDSAGLDIHQMDQYRKMLLGIIKDVRVVLVKLAERALRLRCIQHLSMPQRHVIAKEILDIYAPLANRLGLYSLKWELEDRAFFILYPKVYKKIAQFFGKSRLCREAELINIVKPIRAAMTHSQIDYELTFRIKHFYSIWRKMESKHLKIDALYDLQAMRIFVSTVDECYQTLAILNAELDSVPSEFSDYIAAPKKNGYRSIHAVYDCANGVPLEVQIRTHEMHQAAEGGIAAHWRYKEGVRYDPSYEVRLAWLRSLLDWQKEISEDAEEVLDDRVYIFTPEGDVIDLVKGSTVLDFAYHVHTMVGHRTKGAKINGNIVPLTTKVSTSDRVEILTHKEPNPSKDWANEKMGYVQSSKVRARIMRWLKQKNKASNAIHGKDKLVSHLKPFRITVQIDYDRVAKHFNCVNSEGLFAAIENQDVKLQQVINFIRELYDNLTVEKKVRKITSNKEAVNGQASVHKLDIEGLDDLMMHIAGCCQPEKGDEVVGYVTQMRGVTIHRVDCSVFFRLQLRCPERAFELQWC